MNVQQLEETIAYEHKGAVVYLHLDYQLGKVSIIEKDASDQKILFKEDNFGVFGVKKFLKIILVLDLFYQVWNLITNLSNKHSLRCLPLYWNILMIGKD